MDNKHEGATDQLNEAVSKLEAYAQGAKVSLPSVSRTIAMMRSLFLASFGMTPKRRKHEQRSSNHDAVLSAVETINRHRFYIEKLKDGSKAEKELAASLTQKIDTYNKCCDTRLQEGIVKGKGLTRLLLRKTEEPAIPPKISLPQKITAQKHYPENLSQEIRSCDESLNATEEVINSGLVSIPKQSAELFQMKTLSLLERYGIASNPEARATVKISPIHASADSKGSKYTLTQTLTLFPGQTVVVKASSMLDPQSQTIVKLFPETFCLSIESTQTGFPHPSQRSGWALSHQLLPENPQRIDLLSLSAKIFRRRARAISGLHQPGDQPGALINKAKRRLSEKKKCFQENREKLIDLHRQLSLKIARVAPESQSGPLEGIIANFYDALASHPHPYECLVETNDEIRSFFFAKPHEKLIMAILHGKSTTLNHKNPYKRYEAARRILEEEQILACEEVFRKNQIERPSDCRGRFEYVIHFGKLIGSASINVMLQYFSEDLVYPPPVLSRFESMIQAAAFNHLDGFLKELEMEEEVAVEEGIAVLEQLQGDILDDIAIFDTPSHQFPLCVEMKDYFEARYSSLKNLQNFVGEKGASNRPDSIGCGAKG